MKRKDLDEVHDEFTEFSLFSPATKMRRLDDEVLPVVEGNDSTVPFVFDNWSMSTEPVMVSTSGELGVGHVQVQAMPDTYSGNEERALVLYKPMENPLLLSPDDPSVYFRVSSDLIHGLKNNFLKSADRSLAEMNEKMSMTNNCLAVVPWVPSQANIHSSGINGPESHTELLQEPMEEESEAVSMEVEELKEQQAQNVVGNEGFQQWQQHCMTPGLIPNTSNPIMWSSATWCQKNKYLSSHL